MAEGMKTKIRGGGGWREVVGRGREEQGMVGMVKFRLFSRCFFFAASIGYCFCAFGPLRVASNTKSGNVLA